MTSITFPLLITFMRSQNRKKGFLDPVREPGCRVNAMNSRERREQPDVEQMRLAWNVFQPTREGPVSGRERPRPCTPRELRTAVLIRVSRPVQSESEPSQEAEAEPQSTEAPPQPPSPRRPEAAEAASSGPHEPEAISPLGIFFFFF